MCNFLYIHIPFCISKCIYCDFFSVPFDKTLSEEYVNALCKELILKKQNIKFLKTIYIGGGTPTVLSEKSLSQLFKCLNDNFNFSSDIEITVEMNPGTLDELKIHTLIDSGVNRFSVGVQSFNDNELRFLGRIHNGENAHNTFKLLKKYNLENFSLDLIYGIPGQTMESWKFSLENAVNLSPSHISTYELTLEKNTTLYKLIKDSPNHFTMLDEDLIIEMYNFAIDYLSKNGFEHYEISNFAKPAFKCIHNLNYWDRGEYIGIGAGSHSFFNNVRTSNIMDINEYMNSINSNVLPIKESIVITPREELKEFIFLGLRKKEGINIKKLISSHLVNEKLLNALIKDFIDTGFLELKEDYLRLTQKGILISNTIIVKLFEKLEI